MRFASRANSNDSSQQRLRLAAWEVFPHEIPTGRSDSQQLPNIRYAAAPLTFRAGSAIFADVLGENSGECVGYAGFGRLNKAFVRKLRAERAFFSIGCDGCSERKMRRVLSFGREDCAIAVFAG